MINNAELKLNNLIDDKIKDFTKEFNKTRTQSAGMADDVNKILVIAGNAAKDSQEDVPSSNSGNHKP